MPEKDKPLQMDYGCCYECVLMEPVKCIKCGDCGREFAGETCTNIDEYPTWRFFNGGTK